MKGKDHLFQLVSVTVSTFRKKARKKRKQFPLGGKSLFTTAKSFPQQFFPLISAKVSTCRKKKD